MGDDPVDWVLFDDLSGTENPVTLRLTIGDESGGTTVTAKFE